MKNVISIQSHVAYGYAGNKAAVLPMQLLGIEVWAINTVNFSNHTQYGQWTGEAAPMNLITDLVQGIDNIGKLQECDAILTGYTGTPEQVDKIIDVVKKVKALNPNAIYVLDPVMGHKAKGCSVAPGVAEAIKTISLTHADIVTPNLLELEILTDSTINTFDEVVAAMRKIQEKGVKTVLVKHLESASQTPDNFEMLLLAGDDLYHCSRPLYKLFEDKRPVGVGDLIAATFLANLLNGLDYPEAFLNTNNAVDAVMKITSDANSYELQIIKARKSIMEPTNTYGIEKL